MRKTIKQSIIEALCFSLIILMYTVFFQIMYCLMAYGIISAGVTPVEWMFSLLVNYLPILTLSFGILAVARWTLRIKSSLKKISIDIVASMAILVLINYLFKIITGLSVNWGGSVFNGVLVLLGVEFWLLSRQKQRTLIRENILTKENMSMHYEIQKAYVNPHFLYNTLDMLSSLIEDNKNSEALAFIMRLSGYYRVMTRKFNMPLTTFSEEVNMVRNYLEIVKYRYRDALSFHVEGDIESDPTLVPFSIQLLVENALKHNRISCEYPLCIVVTVGNDSISITNNRNPKIDVPNNSTGIGLTYLRKMYAYHGKNIEIDETDTQFTVTLPTLMHIAAAKKSPA